MPSRTGTPEGSARPPLRVTPWLVAKLGLVAVFAVVLWSLVEHPHERLLTVVLVPVVAVGLVGRHGMPTDVSRLPAATQGTCVGIHVGMAAAVTVFHGWHLPVLAWTAPLIVLFPAVLPKQLRRGLAVRAEVDEEAVERTRWDARGT